MGVKENVTGKGKGMCALYQVMEEGRNGLEVGDD